MRSVTRLSTPERIEATTDTIYDLASLTKPLVTGLLTAKLIEHGELDPNAAVGDLLPGISRLSNAEITVTNCNAHIGVASLAAILSSVEHPDEITTEISDDFSHLDQEPVTYSDLNFLTLAAIVEYLTGSDLASIVEKEIISPA